MDQNYWRKCIVCKNEIAFDKVYYKCSVSSCDKKRAPAQFCSVDCWDVHRSIMNHKNAGADQYRSPNKERWLKEEANQRPTVRIVSSKKSEQKNTDDTELDGEVLVVVSKLKAYIKAKSGLNTSSDVMPILSDMLREKCNQAFQNAHREGRKTLMGKDFK